MADSVAIGKRLDIAADRAEAQLARAMQIANSAGYANHDQAVVGALLHAVAENYWQELKTGAG